MERQEDERLEALVLETGCKKDIHSLVSKPGEYCDCRDTGLKGFLECRHERPEVCKYVLPFGYGFFCKCQTFTKYLFMKRFFSTPSISRGLTSERSEPTLIQSSFRVKMGCDRSLGDT